VNPAAAGFYALKAAGTRARSAAWLARTGGRLDIAGLRILFYHRVAAARDELAVSPRSFSQQMDFLASQSYNVVDVVEAVDLLRNGSLRARTVGLSFDDGFLDVAEHALPVLAGHGFRATVFVAPAVVDGSAWIDGYRRDCHPPILDWDDIGELDRDGTLRFEAHSLTHPNLTALDENVARHEIERSKSALEARLGRPVEAFAYPSGLFGERERRLVDEAGYRVAVSCEPGVNWPETDRLALRRRQIDARDSLLDFRAKVGGGHDSPPPLRDVYRRRRYGVSTGSPSRLSSR
jgi:peptidoglycan/xylan/chitin deacetylase (PgdA/CDA1 family)